MVVTEHNSITGTVKIPCEIIQTFDTTIARKLSMTE